LRDKETSVLGEDRVYRDVPSFKRHKTPATELHFWNPTQNYFANEEESCHLDGPANVVEVVEGNYWKDHD